MKLIDSYNKFNGLVEKSKEDFRNNLKENNFDKEVIARGNYAAAELLKIVQLAVFAEYYNVPDIDIEGFEEIEHFRLLKASLNNPLMIFDEDKGDFKVVNQDAWKEFVEVEYKRFQEYQKQVEALGLDLMDAENE